MGTTSPFWSLQNRREHRTLIRFPMSVGSTIPQTKNNFFRLHAMHSDGQKAPYQDCFYCRGCGCNNLCLDVKPTLPAGDPERLAPAKKYC